MNKLKFYNINDKYIEYLYNFDKRVPYNKNSKRPYIGIIIEINSNTYFAPMFSHKEKHLKLKKNSTFIKIEKNLGIIKLNNMIPVNKENLNYINFNQLKDKKYKQLLIKQNKFIQRNSQLIREKAMKLYDKSTTNKNNYYKEICCNFKLLEEVSEKYAEY